MSSSAVPSRHRVNSSAFISPVTANTVAFVSKLHRNVFISALSGFHLPMSTREINKRNKHTSFGLVNNERVELLRDSGSSVSIARSALVAPEQYTCK